MPDEKLVHMANQIAAFFRNRAEDEAVREIAGHINSFWEQRMRAQLRAYLAAGGAGLDERVKAALAQTRP